LHVHHDVFVEHGGNVPETGSTASVGKAAKALEKYEELEPVRGRKDALLAAAEVFVPTTFYRWRKKDAAFAAAVEATKNE
jgi:hypothetical protein